MMHLCICHRYFKFKIAVPGMTFVTKNANIYFVYFIAIDLKNKMKFTNSRVKGAFQLMARGFYFQEGVY